MTVNGGYGVMLQLPETVLQQSVALFERTNGNRLQVTKSMSFAYASLGISETIDLRVGLQDVRLSLLEQRALRLQFNITASARLTTVFSRVGEIDSGEPLPVLDLGLSGGFTVDVSGVFKKQGDKTSLHLDLLNLEVVSFVLSVNQANVTASPDFLAFLSTLVRREALLLLGNLESIPASWQFAQEIPILGDLHFPVVLDFKVVNAGQQRALAILLQVMNENVDWSAVSYALSQPGDVGIFISLPLMNYACALLCRGLEGTRVNPDKGGFEGDLIFHDVHLHVEAGRFVIDEIKVQSRVLQTIEETVEELLCIATGPCKAICNKVVKTIERVVQIDQLAHASGTFYPKVVDGKIRVDASNVDADASFLLKAVVFTAADALIPFGGMVSMVLMVVGKPLLDKMVTGLAQDQSLDTMINAPLGSGSAVVRAIARDVGWPTGTFAIMSTLTFS